MKLGKYKFPAAAKLPKSGKSPALKKKGAGLKTSKQVDSIAKQIRKRTDSYAKRVM